VEFRVLVEFLRRAAGHIHGGLPPGNVVLEPSAEVCADALSSSKIVVPSKAA